MPGLQAPAAGAAPPPRQVVIKLALLAIAIVVLWLCLPGKDAKMKSYLRGGADVVAAILITCCFGAGIIVLIVGVARYY